jgi:hypothetical protein
MEAIFLVRGAGGPQLKRNPLDGRPDKDPTMKLTKSLGMLLLGAWLILTGLIGLAHLSFSGLWLLMAILALAAGVLIIVGK